MVDKKTIGISSLVTLGIVIMSIITPTFFDDNKFYCESESSIINCPGGLSGGSITRCYLNEEKSSWDYCKSGWINVTDDLKIQEEPEPISDIIYIQDAKQYICDNKGCTEVK